MEAYPTEVLATSIVGGFVILAAFLLERARRRSR